MCFNAMFKSSLTVENYNFPFHHSMLCDSACVQQTNRVGQLLIAKKYVICDDYGCKHNILFNSKKSVCFKIGSKWSSATDCMRLNNEDIKWVSSCKYLGVTFVTGLTLHVDCGYMKRKFYTACNAVLADCTL